MGLAGGSASYIGVDRRTAVIISAISNPAISGVGINLLTERNTK